MWQLDHKEGWVLKNWGFQVVVLGKTLESPLDCKEFKPVHPKGNQPWIFVRRTDAEWSSNTLATRCEEPLIGKDPEWLWSCRQWRQTACLALMQLFLGNRAHQFQSRRRVGIPFILETIARVNATSAWAASWPVSPQNDQTRTWVLRPRWQIAQHSADPSWLPTGRHVSEGSILCSQATCTSFSSIYILSLFFAYISISLTRI